MDDYITHHEEEYEYAEAQLIVTKAIRTPVKSGEKETKLTGECAFIDGVTSDLYNSVSLKIDKMTAGKYIVFYTAKFRKDQLCRKLNVIFYSKYQVELKRLSARKFGIGFLEEINRLNWQR